VLSLQKTGSLTLAREMINRGKRKKNTISPYYNPAAQAEN
jgi:hypothetical protein